MAHQRLVSQSGSGVRQEALRFWLLGGFGLSIGPRTIEADRWRLKKATSLIKLLALTPRQGRRVVRIATTYPTNGESGCVDV